MIRKTALFAAVSAALLVAQPAEARRCRPFVRMSVCSAPVHVQPYYQQPCVNYCYPQPWGYYPVQPCVRYVDCREPEVAFMQDGMNLFFNAISYSRR